MRTLFLIIGLLSSFTIWAQPNDTKRDAIWLIGYRNSSNTDTSLAFNGNIKCNFTNAITTLLSPIRFNETCAGIADTNGKMLFYTNGAIIVDSTYQ